MGKIIKFPKPNWRALKGEHYMVSSAGLTIMCCPIGQRKRPATIFDLASSTVFVDCDECGIHIETPGSKFTKTELEELKCPDCGAPVNPILVTGKYA